MLFFSFQGNEVSRELGKIGRIAVDDEPALTAAEEAFAAGRFDQAVDGYEKTARSSAKPWAREWASVRLVEAAAKSGRFDAAVAGYVQLVLKDPASVVKPPLPEGRSTYLDTAVQQLERALAGRLGDAQQAALLAFLVEIQNARGDEPAANAAAERLDAVLARDPANPAAARAQARRQLQSAGRLISEKKFDQAIADLQAGGERFTEPSEQAEALFLIAEARHAKAGEGDATALQDAALAYMRVVAHFTDVPGRPRVAAALLKAGEISARLGDPQTARRLYDEVIRDFADDPAARSAAAAIKALPAGQ